MFGVLEICECGRKFIRGIYPQKKCYVCDAINSCICFEQRTKPIEAEEKEEEGK